MSLTDNIEFNEKKLQKLIDAITSRKSICYIGAGASIPAKFPDWKKFIERSLDDIQKNYYPKKEFKIARKLLNNGDFIKAAELINLGTKGELNKYINKEFSKKTKPSILHKEITRLPFQMLITTNFDTLIENSFENRKSSYTWSEIKDFYAELVKGEIPILKLHGDGARTTSHILDTKDYEKSIENSALNSYLLNLMLSNTILFVGCSLNDPDLLSILRKGKKIYDDNFGPHFAILFSHEVDEDYTKYLDEYYGIELIVIHEDVPEKRTQKVVNFLRYISGKIALNSINKDDITQMYSNTFNFHSVIKNKLNRIINDFPIDEVNAFFIEDITMPKLKYSYKGTLKDNEFKFQEIKNNIGRTNLYIIANEIFKLGLEKNETYEITDTNDIESYPEFLKNYGLERLNQEDNTYSILASKFMLEGDTVGVLVLKSRYQNIFTENHKQAFQVYLDIFSSLFRNLELRSYHHKKNILSKNAETYQKLLDKSLLLKDYEMSYIFYEIDYRNGKMWAFFDQNKVDFINPDITKYNSVFYYDFEDNSFANYVFTQASEKFIVNVKEGVKSGLISSEGLTAFNINSPIYGCPVRVNNYIGFVLIAWSNKIHSVRKLAKIHEKISRIANLISNSNFGTSTKFENAEKLIENINKDLIDNELIPPWAKNLNKESFRNDVVRVMCKNLLSDVVGIARVRIWIYTKKSKKSDPKEFNCYYSLNDSKSLFDGKPSENAYQGKTTQTDDIYCKFTMNRYSSNPHSILQHRSMFDEKADPNSEELDKDPNGKWIVCPIVHYEWNKKDGSVKKKELLGFISADNHINKGGVPVDERKLTASHEAFQRYAVDLVSDLLAPVILTEIHHREHK